MEPNGPRAGMHARCAFAELRLFLQRHIRVRDESYRRRVGPRLLGRYRCRRRRQWPADGKLHRRDLLLLLDDDLLRNAAQLFVMPVAQLRVRHIDSTLVMRRHQCDKIAIDVARGLDRHTLHHLAHGHVALGDERLFVAALCQTRRAEGAAQADGQQQGACKTGVVVHGMPPHDQGSASDAPRAPRLGWARPERTVRCRTGYSILPR
jgi:hypothetical protein